MDVSLEPQTQLVSRIGLASQDTSKFSFLHGKPGVGKTYVANLLRQKLHNTLVIKLLLKNNLEPEQLKQQLVCELATDELSDLNQPISSAVINAIEHHQQSVMIIIDDAELAQQQSLSALWQAIHEFSRMNHTYFTFNVLLIGDSRWALPFHHGLKNKTDSLVAEYTVTPLSVQQATDFMMVVHADWSDKKISQFIKKISPEYLIPKQLIFTQVNSDKKSKRKVVVWLAFLITFLIVSAFAISYFLNTQSEPLVASSSNVGSENGIMPSTQPTIDVPLEVSHSATTERANDLQIDDAVSLGEPLVMLNNTTDETIDNMIIAVEEEKITDETAPIDEIISAESIADLNDSDVQLEPPLNQMITFEDNFDEQTLMDLPHTGYSLMLGGYNQLETLKTVQQQFSKEQLIRAYSSRRDGKAWYVLLYGDFESISAANDFVRVNQDKFRDVSPWAKSLKTIQSEISIGRLPVENNK